MGKGSIPSPPTAPRKPSKYCTWPSPAPRGPGPALSLVEAPGTKVLGGPHTPKSAPDHDREQQSSHRGREGLGLLVVFSQGCFREEGREHCWSESAWGLGRGKQAEGGWTGKSRVAGDRVTPSIGGGGLCCHLGPLCRCCRPRC